MISDFEHFAVLSSCFVGNGLGKVNTKEIRYIRKCIIFYLIRILTGFGSI